MNKIKILHKKQTKNLPRTSGVYFFYSKKLSPKPYSPNPIYIGKAVNIKNRVKNHFQSPSYKDNFFISSVDKIGYIKTKSEIEALILEANLIKKHQPKYNKMWRDDKNYFYVAITKNKIGIPYIYVTHQPKTISNFKFQISNSQYIGPFVEGTALKKTLKFLRKIFPYYTTPKHPRVDCSYCHLDLCPGPAPDLINYRKNIKKLVLILQGKKSSVLNSLKREMKIFAKAKKFEEAGKARDKIYALEKIMAHTYVINNNENSGFLPYGKKPHTTTLKLLQKILKIKNEISRIECYDISNIQGKFATGSMVVFTNGKPNKSQYKKFKIRLPEKPNDIAMLKEVLQRRFKHREWKYPEVILIDGGKAQLNVAIEIKKLRRPKGYPETKIISIAKGRQELFIENHKEPIPLKELPQEIYNLIKNLDDEAHRFAITYHRKLRKKELIG